MTTRHLAFAAACCLALAVASLPIAHEPVYDAWAWLVWGRELAGLGLDTSSGPSWKPLPVAITSVLSLTGDAAPALWLVLVRASWLLAVVLAASLAHRLTADLDGRLRWAAAAVAAISLLLLADDVTLWTRQGAAGMSEPPLVALVLGAVGAALAGRSRLALALAGLAALIRPEVWPLLAAYGVWRWHSEPALRPWIAAIAIAVPALWIVPGLLSSGDVVSAGERAQRGGGSPLRELVEVFGRVAAMPLLMVWPLALFAITGDRRVGPDRALGVLAAGALAWIAVVGLMAAAGFPGLPRYMAPAAAILGVLAGAGFARWLALTRRSRGGVVFAIPLLVLVILQLPARAAELPHAMAITARIARSHDDLRALANAVGRERLLRCGKLATSDVLVRTALAWELHVALSEVVSFGALPSESGAFVVGPQASPLLRGFMRAHTHLLAARGEWSVYSIDCDGAAASSSSASVRSVGVSGAVL